MRTKVLSKDERGKTCAAEVIDGRGGYVLLANRAWSLLLRIVARRKPFGAVSRWRATCDLRVVSLWLREVEMGTDEHECVQQHNFPQSAFLLVKRV